MIFLVILVVLIIPYLWILPIYHTGNYFKKRGMLLAPNSFRWSLRHFWIICSLYIFVNVLSELVFNYDSFFDQAASEEEISFKHAKETLFIFIGYLLTTLLVTRLSDLPMVWGSSWNKQQSILKGIGAVFLLRVFLGIYLLIYKHFETPEAPELFILSINKSIQAINQYYHPLLGFLFVAIIGPIYEEFLFRGVILSASEKHMRFLFANILQAFFFGLVHVDLKLFPFFFVFGFIAGYYRNRSQSLAPGIAMHIVNNTISFFAILRLG